MGRVEQIKVVEKIVQFYIFKRMVSIKRKATVGKDMDKWEYLHSFDQNIN